MLIIAYVGLVLLAISLICDFVEVDIDFTELEFPLSFRGVLFGMVCFGVVGKLFGLLGAFLAGLCGYIIIYYITKLLKQVQSFADTDDIVVGMIGTVSNKIVCDGYGNVVVQVNNKTLLSYPAKSIDGGEILQDQLVEITKIEAGVVIVKEYYGEK